MEKSFTLAFTQICETFADRCTSLLILNQETDPGNDYVINQLYVGRICFYRVIFVIYFQTLKLLLMIEDISEYKLI